MHGELFFGLVAFGFILWLAGHDLINHFFRRKEGIINRMLNSEKGDE